MGSNLCMMCPLEQHVNIRTQSQSFVVQIVGSNTFKDLKEKISKLKNISSDDFVLKYRGRKLDQNQKLQNAAFVMSLDDYLQMSILDKSTGEIKISIRNINFTQQVKVKPQNRVKDLKQKIEKKQNIAVRKQRLIFSGKVMQDDQELSKYNITEGSTVHLAIVLIE